MPSKLNDKCNWNCDINDDEKVGKLKMKEKLVLQSSDIQLLDSQICFIDDCKIHSWNFWYKLEYFRNTTNENKHEKWW